MSKIEVDAITEQSGSTLTTGGGAGKTVVVDATTVTLGRCGGTVALASGATQSGFGRSGSVNWQTTPKTTTFTAADGEGYFVNTTSGAVTVNLPAGSAGAIVAINDYANTAASNNITIDSNGAEKIQGSTLNHLITTNGVTVTLVYVDSTQGWKLVDTGEVSSFPQVSLFTIATVSGSGNTLTTAPDCANYKIATFTGPGTFCVSQIGNSPANPSGGPANASFLVVAGGGGGDNGGGAYGGGGAGAGGFRTDHPSTAGTIPLSVSGIPIQVGAGGSGGPSETSGANSVFSTITSAGGGSGRTPGGSGGGAAKTNPNGTGNTPPTTPPQGRDGGTPAGLAGAGGGGSGGTGGTPAPNQRGGPGGIGTANTITGSSVTRAGGGGGGASTWACTSAPKDGGPGGPGGGGDGGNAVNSNPAPATINGVAATVNTGSGGGAGAWCSGGPGGPSPQNQPGSGGNGGSGVVIIRYKFQ